MMMSGKNKQLPQVGRENSPKSHPDLSGCLKDSGGGSQTLPAAEASAGEGDPSLVFRRSHLLARSPPLTQMAPNVPMLGVTNISPPPAPFKAENGGAEVPQKVQSPVNPSQSEDVETELLKGMADLVESMLKTLKVQKNVNVGIKDGLPKLKDQLQQMMELVQRRLNPPVGPRKEIPGRKRARNSSSGSPGAGSPTGQRPAVSTETRGTQVSPSAVQILAAPEKEVPPPPNPSGDGEWTKHLSRKERKRRRRAEAAPKKELAAVASKAAAATPAREVQRGKNPAAPKKPRPRKPRSEAILIKPLGGRSFADVLGDLKTKAKPEDHQTVVKSIRRTQGGDVLLELGKSADKAGFTACLKEALGNKGAVRELDPKSSVEVRDLDGLSTEKDVVEAIKKAVPDVSEEAAGLKVWLTKPNRSQQRMAVVELREKLANKLLSLQHLRVGWVNCRLRRRVVVPRCFRCLGYGHSSRNCRGPDRSKNCLRCGDEGHKRKDCAKTCCFLCKERGLGGNALGHIPGSGKCSDFKAALEQTKGKAS